MTFHAHRRGLAATTSLIVLALAGLAAPAWALPTGYGAQAGASATGTTTETDGGAGAGSANAAATGDGATAWSSANLASGFLQAVAQASCQQAVCRSTANASLWEQVVFTNADGSPLDGAALVPTSISLNGALAGAGHAKVRTYFGYDGGVDVDSLAWIDLTEGGDIFDNLFIMPTSDPLFVYIELMVEADGAVQSLADFGGGLTFDWELPETIAAQSQSGVFLTQTPSAVPEPASWALMIVGVGLMGATLRRRRPLTAA